MLLGMSGYPARVTCKKSQQNATTIFMAATGFFHMLAGAHDALPYPEAVEGVLYVSRGGGREMVCKACNRENIRLNARKTMTDLPKRVPPASCSPVGLLACSPPPGFIWQHRGSFEARVKYKDGTYTCASSPSGHAQPRTSILRTQRTPL